MRTGDPFADAVPVRPPAWIEARDALIAIAAAAFGVVLTRLTWPFLLRAPFVPLFAVVFTTARWATETASLLAIAAAGMGTVLLAPPGDAQAPPWWMCAGFVLVAIVVRRVVVARNRAEDALRASERRYRRLFRDNPMAMWVRDIDTGRFLAVNEAALARYGYSGEELLGLTLRDLTHDAAPARADVPGAEQHGVSVHRTKGGARLDVQIDSSVITWGGRPAHLELVQDITERAQLKEQLNQSQKMEAIGQLAGGVAHDFNNILTTIQGYADLLLTQIGPDKSIWKDLHEIQSAATRAALLTHQLLAFSRQQQFDLVPVDVNDIVRRLSRMLRRLISEDIELDLSLADDPVHARADVSRLEQVLINLVVNARDAIRGPGGRITIRTRVAGRIGSHTDNDARVVLEVADNGSGMDEATRRRCFEPFFTTKRAGAGTGLGLATAYGIVQQCGGRIDVESAPGEGATFRVFLPWSTQAPRAAPVPGAADALVGSEHILVVEDSTELRLLASQVLKRHGYDVLEAAVPEDALAFAGRRDLAIDLILMDVVMPRMMGPEIVGHLKRVWPHAAVLYMTGYEPDALLRRGVAVDESRLLKKPFSAAELLSRVRALLDNPVAELL